MNGEIHTQMGELHTVEISMIEVDIFVLNNKLTDIQNIID